MGKVITGEHVSGFLAPIDGEGIGCHGQLLVEVDQDLGAKAHGIIAAAQTVASRVDPDTGALLVPMGARDRPAHPRETREHIARLPLQEHEDDDGQPDAGDGS